MRMGAAHLQNKGSRDCVCGHQLQKADSTSNADRAPYGAPIPSDTVVRCTVMGLASLGPVRPMFCVCVRCVCLCVR